MRPVPLAIGDLGSDLSSAQLSTCLWGASRLTTQQQFDLASAPPVRSQPVQSLAQIATARNILRAALARMDGYLDAYPQRLGIRPNGPSKHPDAYSGFALQPSTTSLSRVPITPSRATFCAQPNRPASSGLQPQAFTRPAVAIVVHLAILNGFPSVSKRFGSR
jgi:hypothetical protein